MIKNICKDLNILSKKSEDITKNDLNALQDLKDTLKYHLEECVGMALNMIGINKNGIVFVDENNTIHSMINPKIIKKSDEYETFEGFLSLDGKRKTTRYKKIKVEYFDEDFKIKIKTYEGFEAQIIQHEIDHLFGIII